MSSSVTPATTRIDSSGRLPRNFRGAVSRVFCDELTLTLGDSRRRSIDRGPIRSRLGNVVISHGFLNREWPQKELDGLIARESDGTKVILPVWHDISADEVRSFSRILAGRVATRSSAGLERTGGGIATAIKAGRPGTFRPAGNGLRARADRRTDLARLVRGLDPAHCRGGDRAAAATGRRGRGTGAPRFGSIDDDRRAGGAEQFDRPGTHRPDFVSGLEDIAPGDRLPDTIDPDHRARSAAPPDDRLTRELRPDFCLHRHTRRIDRL